MMAKISEAAEKHFERFGELCDIDAAKERELRELNEQRFQQMLTSSQEIVEENTARLQDSMGAAIADSDEWLRQSYEGKVKKSRKQKITDRVSTSACILSNSGDEYKAIFAATTSGRTARMISRFRPDVSIIGGAHDAINRRRMTVSFGVYPLNIGKSIDDDMTSSVFRDAEEVFQKFRITAKKEDYVKDGDTVVFTSGTPLFVTGTTNVIQIKEVMEGLA